MVMWVASESSAVQLKTDDEHRQATLLAQRLLPLLLAFLGATAPSTNALSNGQALTPPMGFISWQRFRCNVDCAHDPDNCVSERLFKSIADAMVSEGYRDAGYVSALLL